MVWRIQQACRRIVLACSQIGAKYRESHIRLVATSAHVPRDKIFIDEIDSLFRSRSSNDHEVTGMMKAEFMTCVFERGALEYLTLKVLSFRLWDGLTSGEETRVIVLGATNRPNE